MFRTIKKSTFLLAFVAILSVIGILFFSPRLPNQLKSSVYSLGTSELLWGQAYSPNIGWINFYCDGNNKTQPTIVTDPSRGAVSMPDFCGTIAYGITFNSSTNKFSGEAYSSDYGWLDMNDLTMDASYKFHGSTDGSTFSDYNFGTTYFQKNDPNSLNPGVGYDANLGYFCGLVYSDTAGFISFCDPGTKDSSSAISGFDFNTYAVYLGGAPGTVPINPPGATGAICVNSVTEAGEECDDGNAVNTDACLNNCTNASCGDGHVQSGVEQCDDGNTTSGDGCSDVCITEASGTDFSCVINNKDYFGENRLPGLTSGGSTIASGNSKSLAENSYLALGGNGWLEGTDDIICTNVLKKYAIFDAASLSSSTVSRSGNEYTYTLTDENNVTASVSAKFSFPIAKTTCTQNPSSGSTTTSTVPVAASCPTSKLTNGCTSNSQNYTFNTNGSHVFYWEDTIGRRATCSAEVSWIDKRSYSLTSSNCGSPNPSTYSTSWLSSASPSAYDSLGNSCSGTCTSCTVPGTSSSCSIPQGIGQSCTVSISNSCGFTNKTTWCSSGGWDDYQYCGADICVGEYRDEVCTPNCWWSTEWSCYSTTTDCSYPSSATCSDSYSCTSAQANIDNTAPTTSSGLNNVIWTPASSDFWNWSEWTDESITAQIGCDDNLSGCSPLSSSGSAGSNQALSISVSDSAGNSTSTSVAVSDWIDKTDPAMTSVGETFAANGQKYITVGFADGDSELRSVAFTINGDNGLNLSCVDDEGQTNTAYYHDVGSDSSWIAGLTCDFSVAQNYNIQATACDVAGNCTNPTGNGLYSNFYQVIAAAPTSSNSYFEFSSPPIIADGQNSHFVRAVFRDTYGNPVVSVAGIKEVKVAFTFENTTNLDQIAKTGDSAKFTSTEFGLNQDGGTATTFFTEAAGGDGKFQIDVKSFAPTSNGYTPIESDEFNLWFDKITYQVAALNGLTNVGEGSGTFASTDPARKFAFKPALISTPEALIWDGSAYITDSSGIENITINAPKRLNVDLLNQSGSVTISSPKIGVALNDGSGNVLWKEGRIEKISSTDGLTEVLSLDTDNDTIFDGTGILKNLSSWISGISFSTSKNLRFRATPELQTSSMAENSTTTLQTYLCYNDGKDVCHRSEKLASGGSALLQNPSIEIIGSVQSSGATSSKQTGTELNQSLGDIAQNELKNAIGPNILALTQNPASSVCDSDVTITTTSELTSLGCKNNASSIFYFKDHNLTLGDGTPFTLPSGAKTILVENGNLHIKSNLAYPTGNTNSFGVIVLNGNIFVYPGVTSVVGAFYSDGSLVSVNASGKCGEDASPSCDGTAGFCDRSYELRNQLYWKGLIATQNTIGGADSSPLKFPSGIATSCPPPSCSTESPSCTSSEIARIYDLAYLRTFNTEAAALSIPEATRANRASGTTSDNALVVEYDSRIQNNPPPLFGVSTGGSSTQLSN